MQTLLDKARIRCQAGVRYSPSRFEPIEITEAASTTGVRVSFAMPGGRGYHGCKKAAVEIVVVCVDGQRPLVGFFDERRCDFTVERGR